MNIPVFWASDENLFMEIEVIITEIVAKLVYVLDILCVGIRVTEGKVHFFALFPEIEVKDAL